MFILEFPQNLIGFLAFLIFTKTKKRPYRKYQDAYVVHVAGIWGAFTLSKYIFADDNCYLSDIIKHEYGHRIQSHLLWFLYLPVIGFPSLIWAAIFRIIKPKKYYWFYTEAWANRLINSDFKNQ